MPISPIGRKPARSKAFGRLRSKSVSSHASLGHSAESTVESALQYTALAAAESQQIKVTETRTLVSGTDSVQLANREVVRPQGTHVSNMKFTLPKDVAKGSYTLVTTVSDGKNTKTVKNPLQVV